VENGGFGAEYGVPIGALMIEKYLTGNLTEESEQKAETSSKKRIYYGKEER
jgi:penicillin-binding protein 2